MRKLLLLILMTLGQMAWCRTFQSVEVSALLQFQSIENPVSMPIGGPIRWIYQFSDDGLIVTENNQTQRGVWIRQSGESLLMAFHVIALQDLVSRLLDEAPLLSSQERQRHRHDLMSFLALSISHFRPLEFHFTANNRRASALYQLHSPYSGEEDRSYHLMIQVTQPVTIPN